MNEHIVFTEEALKAQEGKKVPLKDEPGGMIIGEATLHYDVEAGELKAKLRIDNQIVAEYLEQDATAIIFKRES